MDDTALVRMANQIAAFFTASGHDAGVKGTAGHIRSFWDPRMRRALYACADKGGAGLDPLVMDAVNEMRKADRAVTAGQG
jgi:formate dehydrogenase subunit delta